MSATRLPATCPSRCLASPGGIVVSRGTEVLTGATPRATIVHAIRSPTAVTGTGSRHYSPVALFQHP